MSDGDWGVFIDRRAEKEIQRLPKHVRQALANATLLLAADPLRPRPGLDVRPLRGYALHRLRIGSYRFLLWIDTTKRIVTITSAGARKNVYRPG